MERPLKERLLSRNFWNFAIASTIATIVFLHLLAKCYNLDGSFDHGAAESYYNVWGNTIALFTVLFLGKELSSKVVDMLPSMRGKGKEPPTDYVAEGTRVDVA